MTTPPPGDGRNQVVDLSVIDTDWGNAIADRTVQSYANQSDLNSVWGAARNGSTAYTVDTDEFWVRQGGVWKRTPGGYIGGVVGPAVQIACQAWTTLIEYDFPAKVGRRYLLDGYVDSQQITANGATGVVIRDDQGLQRWLKYESILVPGASLAGSCTMIYTPTATKTAAIQLVGGTSAGQLVIPANWAQIQVIDIGGL
jgi:hypothetical protein